MKIDDTTLAIIKQLRDGRKSFREIADELSLSENTVRGRVNRLLDEGILTISGLVDPDFLYRHTMAFVGVKLNTMDLVTKGKEFSELRGVVSVSVVTGRFDLILIILLKEDFSLLNFYTDEVVRIKDVQSVETFVIYKGYNMRVPYIL